MRMCHVNAEIGSSLFEMLTTTFLRS